MPLENWTVQGVVRKKEKKGELNVPGTAVHMSVGRGIYD